MKYTLVLLMLLASVNLNSQTHDHHNCNGFLPISQTSSVKKYVTTFGKSGMKHTIYIHIFHIQNCYNF